jgi:4-hydroxy-tetrahydrodipicolinate synthase
VHVDHREGLRRGLWGVLATPFLDETGPVDYASLDRQIALHGRAGSVGLVALGVFGEAVKLAPDEQLSLVKFTSERTPGQRIVIGLSALDTEQVIASGLRLAEAAATEPVLMVQLNSADPEVVIDHVGTVSARTGLKIVLQDYPVASGVRISSADVARIAEACPAVVAVKSEAPPTSPAIATITEAVDVPVFGGLGGLGLLDELAAGAAGAMTGFSFPEVLAKVVAAYREGGYQAARAEYLPWLPLVNFEAQAVVGIAIRKASLRLRGVFTSGAVRSPGPAMTEALHAILKQHHDFLPLERLG